MCLIFVAHQVHERYRLVVAANRDEFYARPTKAAEFWPQAPAVLAGRDLEAGGTWLGISKSGRFAAVTNYRDAEAHSPGAKSRGELVRGFLVSTASPTDYASDLRARGAEYSGFGLLIGDASALWYCSNRVEHSHGLAPGIYGLSNHLLDTPWPKVERGKAMFWELLQTPEIVAERLLDMMYDTSETPPAGQDVADQDTGFERALSAMFVRSPRYGTRSTTVVLVEYSGEVEFLERSYPPGVAQTEQTQYRFSLERQTQAFA